MYIGGLHSATLPILRPTGPGSTEQAETERQAELRRLQVTDRRVRSHEQAHSAVGGRYAGAPQYEFQRGPDGVLYAVGGEVTIDSAPVAGDPQATIDKMKIVHAAALAPTDPSAQDHRVAAQALQEKLSAELALAAERGSVIDTRA